MNSNGLATIERQLASNDLPLVSIGVPTYNGAKRIASALTSILDQGYPHLEVVISDNCSTDDTEAVCNEFCKRNQSVRYFRQKENIGIMANFDFVLRQASGQLFMWTADDDSLEPGILHKYVAFMRAHPDYALVSGEIRYWSGDKPAFVEKDFIIEEQRPGLRVMRFYSKVVHGAIFYGLMPRAMASRLSLQNRMGEDWHFIAKAAYLGKIKNLDCIGYNKKLDGTSRTLKQYAKLIGAPWFATNFPHAQIALDAFAEVMTAQPFNVKPFYSRFIVALGSMAGVLFNHYFKTFPRIVGGKILRLLGFKKRLRKSRYSMVEEWTWRAKMGLLFLLEY